MKLYKIFLADKRHATVAADTYQEVDDKFVFFRGGQPIPDVFFLASTVAGITVESDDFDPNAVPRVIPEVEDYMSDF